MTADTTTVPAVRPDDPDWRDDVDALVGPPVKAEPTAWHPVAATPGSLVTRAVRAVMAKGFERAQRARPGMDADPTPEQMEKRLHVMRRQFESWARKRKVADDVTITEGLIGGVTCETVTVPASDTRRVVLWLHGGAYVLCSPRTHRGLAAAAARATRARVVVPDYRLAPEAPFPAGLEDALAVYRGLLATGTRAEDIVVGGDSAGGGLGLALLLALKLTGEALPAAYVGFSPWTDLTGSGTSIAEREDHDPWLSGEQMHVVVEAYGGGLPGSHPLLSPLFGDLSGLPPMLVQVGTHEVLLDDALRLADRVAGAGGDVKLQVTSGAWHVFQIFGHLPDSKRAWRAVGRFADRHLATAAR